MIIDSIQDPIERKSIIDHLQNFGQIPPQLFTKPHPKRNSSSGMSFSSSSPSSSPVTSAVNSIASGMSGVVAAAQQTISPLSMRRMSISDKTGNQPYCYTLKPRSVGQVFIFCLSFLSSFQR